MSSVFKKRNRCKGIEIRALLNYIFWSWLTDVTIRRVPEIIKKIPKRAYNTVVALHQRRKKRILKNRFSMIKCRSPVFTAIYRHSLVLVSSTNPSSVSSGRHYRFPLKNDNFFHRFDNRSPSTTSYLLLVENQLRDNTRLSVGTRDQRQMNDFLTIWILITFSMKYIIIQEFDLLDLATV